MPMKSSSIYHPRGGTIVVLRCTAAVLSFRLHRRRSAVLFSSPRAEARSLTAPRVEIPLYLLKPVFITWTNTSLSCPRVEFPLPLRNLDVSHTSFLYGVFWCFFVQIKINSVFSRRWWWVSFRIFQICQKQTKNKE